MRMWASPPFAKTNPTFARVCKRPQAATPTCVERLPWNLRWTPQAKCSRCGPPKKRTCSATPTSQNASKARPAVGPSPPPAKRSVSLTNSAWFGKNLRPAAAPPCPVAVGSISTGKNRTWIWPKLRLCSFRQDQLSNWLNLRRQKQNLDLAQTETLQFQAGSAFELVEPPQVKTEPGSGPS